ncbi:conserved hypothetical protein [Perkinsus marinus ATCC 50983]|uniref:Uncharacterized protein n=1 Tax=Perkinsus marinus (strain ATCC 50983 / TXsc) TaxID=423536 RepID=C5KHA6_PERM5|nr:conserved hypothetical protein [Perkinsus marinus ATCC 50983]EER15968.1 conserved hypothetical protein [Perkinsus marinus ATCC 50983]|eukprot:XP_002784172.1 conserved hypothetical protein [Perkinsus marinus ATCC 50983]
MPAGIGGGILFVPVLRLIGGLSQKESSSLSQALVAASALAANLFNFYAQYRAKNEPKALIVWPFVILMLPCAVVGSLIGIYLYSWLPSLLQLILYFIVACFGSLAAYRKGYKLWKAETDAKESAIREFDSTTTVTCSPSVEPEEVYHLCGCDCGGMGRMSRIPPITWLFIKRKCGRSPLL